MYSSICKYFFHTGREDFLDASLHCTVRTFEPVEDPFDSYSYNEHKAYTLLSDSAAQHIANQNKLRDVSVLGG